MGFYAYIEKKIAQGGGGVIHPLTLLSIRHYIVKPMYNKVVDRCVLLCALKQKVKQVEFANFSANIAYFPC